MSGSIPHPRLRAAVVALWAAFLGYGLYRLAEEPFVAVAAAALIATAALCPAYLWTAGRAPGLPILPLHLLALLWTFAFPLVGGHPEIGQYDADEIVRAAISVALYGLAATGAWYLVALRPPAERPRYYVLEPGRGFVLFAAAIVLGGLFTTLAVAGRLDISPGLYGIVRSAILSFASLGLFLLAVRWGRRELSDAQRWLFLTAALLFIVLQLATLYLVGAIVSTACVAIGFIIGRGRVPWVAIALAVLVFGFLHSGKGEMRERYWSPEAPPVAPYELPGLFAEWIGAGAVAIVGSEGGLGEQPIQERLSLMHMLLLVQRNSPDPVPYLRGETYAIIPALLVPRIIAPDKPHSHQGTATLNLRYGIQTLDDVEGTTIGWGLLNEAYANFGLGGVVVLAALLGAFFGAIGRMCARAPLMSLEYLVGVTFAVIAIQAEFTMAVFATVVFQSLVVLGLVLPLLRRRPRAAAG